MASSQMQRVGAYDLPYEILKRISPEAIDLCGGPAGSGGGKLAAVLGEEVASKVSGKVVIDFGCGEGADSVEMALRGATRVIGIDIRKDRLEAAARRARSEGLENCFFATSTNERADMIISVDAFEHFADPAGILRMMDGLLKPSGEVLVSFGPTWYHPLGGHLFSVFPWAHLLFSERALIRWRSSFKDDGATRFGEVSGGLNQITIAQFEKLVAKSPLRFASFELMPIQKLRRFHGRLTREFTTAVVRCRLVKRTA